MDENKQLISAVDYYFLEEDGSRFKVVNHKGYWSFKPTLKVAISNSSSDEH